MVFSPGKQWDPATFAQAQEILKQQQEQKQPKAPESFDTSNKSEIERTTGQPAGMEERSLRPPKAPVFYRPPVNDQKVVYSSPTTEKPLPGRNAPVVISNEGNPNITESFKDLPTPPPPEAFENTPPKPASNPVMYEVPQEKSKINQNQVQLGMKPPQI